MRWSSGRRADSESLGRATYLSSVSASRTAPWPGLGAYIVSKAALERLIEVWEAEHPEVGLTRMIVGDSAGGAGDCRTEFADSWDPRLASELASVWSSRNLRNGGLVDVDDLVDAVDAVLRSPSRVSIPSIVVTPRPPAAASEEDKT